MKKTIIIIVIVLLSMLFFLQNCGFSMGNFTIGKQPTFITEQVGEFSSSEFYKSSYQSDSLLVINLWATWCEPCVEEMPLLNEVKKHYKNSPIKFISISVDNDSIKLQKFLNKNIFEFDDITFANIQHRTAIINTLDGKSSTVTTTAQAVPVTYIVKDKEVLDRFNGQVTKAQLLKSIDEKLRLPN